MRNIHVGAHMVLNFRRALRQTMLRHKTDRPPPAAGDPQPATRHPPHPPHFCVPILSDCQVDSGIIGTKG